MERQLERVGRSRGGPVASTVVGRGCGGRRAARHGSETLEEERGCGMGWLRGAARARASESPYTGPTCHMVKR